MALCSHREQVAKELLVHVSLAQKGACQHLLLRQAQAGAAVDVTVQVQPLDRHHMGLQVDMGQWLSSASINAVRPHSVFGQLSR